MNEEQIARMISSLLMQGDIEMQAGDFGAARNAYQRAKDISRKLSLGENAGFAIACDKLGDIGRFSKQFSIAHKEYDQALPIFRKLAAMHHEHRRDLSLCLSKIGELALAEGNIPAAKLALEEHYTIAEQIATSDPSHCEHQRDLAGAYGRLQQLAKANGNLAEAIGNAEAAHVIMEKLAAIDPSNASWIQDLAGSDFVYAMLLLQSGDTGRAVSMLKNSLRLLRELAQQEKLDAKGKRLLAKLGEQFGFKS